MKPAMRLFGAMCFALWSAAAASAADYPAKPVRIITTAPAGGGTDLVLRVFADKLSREWNQQVVVENRAGGGGIIASQYVAGSPPDGYTLLGTFDAHATNPSFLDNLPYDTLKDFTPISLLSTITMMVVTSPSLPVSSVQELVALAKQKPGQIDYASIGKGSPQYIIGELFKDQAGIDLRHISYKERSAINADVLAGRMPIMVSSVAGVLAYIQAGTMKPLAMTSSERSPLLPNVPTFREAGLPGVHFVSWVGLFGPANMPRDVVEKINAGIRKVATLPELKDQIAKAGGEASISSPQEFDAMIRKDMQNFSDLARKVNAKPGN
jgi:tripartite-type tricarboxylate transporter receptor subunit TctC